MRLDGKLLYKEYLLYCPKCRSERLEAFGKDQIRCLDCQTTFRLAKSDDGLRQTASLFFSQAQDLMEQGMEPELALQYLESARVLLETVLKRKHFLSNTRYQLGMLYLSLGDLHRHLLGVPDKKKALACYRKSLDFFKKSKDQENKGAILFLEGLLYDKIVFTSYEEENPLHTINLLEKCVECYEEAYSLEPDENEEQKVEKMEKNRPVKAEALAQAAKNLWSLGQVYRNLNQFDKALEKQQQLLKDLEILYESVPELKTIMKAGLAMTHHEIAKLIDLLDPEQREQLKEKQHYHLRQSEHFYYYLKEPDQIAFLEWLGFEAGLDQLDEFNKRNEKETEMDELDEEYDYEQGEPLQEGDPWYIRPEDLEQIAAAYPEMADWNELSEKQREQLDDKMTDRLNEHMNSYLEFATREEAQFLAETLLQDVEEFEKEAKSDPERSLQSAALYCSQMAMIFKEHDFPDLYLKFGEYAIYFFEHELERDLERERADLLREFVARLCYELGSEEPDRERADEMLDLAVERLHEIEDKESITSPDLYGEVMFLKSQDLKAQGNYAQAAGYAREAREWLGEKRYRELEKLFSN